MDAQSTLLRVNPKRLRTDLDALGKIGATSDGGVDRPALSQAHLAARTWLRQRVVEAGLDFRTDGAGNYSGYLGCGPSSAPTLLLGSHLDSVPHGGRFDGALGVLSALEVLRVVKEEGLHLPVNLEMIDFTDEEGTFIGLLGSQAVTGYLKIDDINNPRGDRETLLQGLQRAGLSEQGLLTAKRDPHSLAGYLELHIEQGPRLSQAQVDIGVVRGIVGIYSYQVKFLGNANHAGTTPMEQRRNAALGACSFTLAVHQITKDEFTDCVANVGEIQLKPGAFNIIPGEARLSLEIRSLDVDRLRQLEIQLFTRAKAEAEHFGLMLETQKLEAHPPAPMSMQVQQVIIDTADMLGFSHMRLASGAGHDAYSFAGLCPTGMILVPSQNGVSHSPAEYTIWRDCLNGANMLLQSALRLAMELPLQ